MLKIVSEIGGLQKEISQFRPLDVSLQRKLQERLRAEWTYNSNAIEGNTLTFGETIFFLREGLTSEGRPLKDYLETRNHAEAIDGLHDILAKKRELTEGLIKELHAVLLKGAESTEALGANGVMIQKPVHAGQYKIRPNHVLTLSGKIHHYADPLHVKEAMEKLLGWYHQTGEIHPVEKGALFHYRFVGIHPFDDGNGRLARLLMNLILMQNGYPPCIIRMVRRRKYLEALEATDASGETTPFVSFVAEELLATQQTILDVLTGQDSGLNEGEGKPLNRGERERLLLDIISKENLSISQIQSRLPQVKRPTLKSDLQRLVRTDKLKKRGIGKGVIYSVS